MCLGHNEIGGTLPTQYGQLTALEVLQVDNNRLNGTLPTEYGNLFSLTELECRK